MAPGLQEGAATKPMNPPAAPVTSPMRWLFPVVLLATAFAGCFEDSDPQAPPEPDPVVADGTGALGYDVDPETANETMLEGAHIHDEWGGTKEMVLMDETVSTADCGDGNPFTTLFITGAGIVFDRAVHMGCAQFQFGEGRIVPEGTASLRIEVDATDALKQGVLELAYRSPENDFDGAGKSDGPVFMWRIEMVATEWDLPHSTQTEWGFFLQPSGDVAVLDGDIKVFIAAERVEDWTPILGSAHIDHWAPDAAHDFVAEDAMRVLDVNTTVQMPSFADRLQGDRDDFDSIPLQDIVAPGSVQLTLVVWWTDMRNCPAQHECWIVPFINAGDRGRGAWLDPVESTPEWAIYVYDIPEPLTPDSTYANNSTYSVSAFVRSCIPGMEDIDMPFGGFRPCFGEAVASMEADTWFYAETWKGPARLDELKARVGLA